MAEKDLTMAKTVTIENVGEEPVAFRYFRVNFAETLEAGDRVVLTAGSSEERNCRISGRKQYQRRRTA